MLSYAAGNPPLSNEGWLKVAPLVMFEFALFNFLLLVGGRATNRLRHWFFGTDPSAPDFAPVSREERVVFGLLAGVGLVALAASVAYLRVTTKNYQETNLEVLERMADLKAGQIEQWRRERLGDAATLLLMPGLSGEVQALGEPGRAAQRARFVEWLQQFVRSYGYANLVVFDRALQPVLSEPGGVELPGAELRQRLPMLRPGSDVMELPPYVDGAGRLRWDLLVPLAANTSSGIDGAILLQTKPAEFIIPTLRSWPKEYQTGQSALWYREGERLILLGGYRPAPGVTPDELRPFGLIRDISDSASPSLLARAARGDLRAAEGLDHRGVMVLGNARPIAESTWLLASRVDSAEVYAPLRRTAVGVAGIVAGLFVITGFAMSWLWRQRQRDLLHDSITAELEQKRLAARLGAVMLHAKDVILILGEDLHVADANQQAVDTYGWPRAELLQKTIWDLRSSDSPMKVEDVAAGAAEGRVFESLHRRKDGTTLPVEVSLRRVELDGQPHLLCIVRDIAERKQAEAALRASEERYRLIADNTSDLIWLYDQTANRFTYASPSSLPLLGYPPEEIVGAEAAGLRGAGFGGARAPHPRTGAPIRSRNPRAGPPRRRIGVEAQGWQFRVGRGGDVGFGGSLGPGHAYPRRHPRHNGAATGARGTGEFQHRPGEAGRSAHDGAGGAQPPRSRLSPR